MFPIKIGVDRLIGSQDLRYKDLQDENLVFYKIVNYVISMMDKWVNKDKMFNEIIEHIHLKFSQYNLANVKRVMSFYFMI